METVYARRIPSPTIDQVTLRDFEVDIGGMTYGFPINGILGMDVLTTAGALVNLQRLSIEFASAPWPLFPRN